MRVTHSITVRITTALLTRLFSKVRISTAHFYHGDPCWEWTGFIHPEGYGRTHIQQNGRTVSQQAHRLFYILFVAPIPSDQVCDHLCKVRHCVNPAHLEAVTDETNILRGEGIAPRRKAQTHCVHGHELSGDNVGKCGTGRACKECKKRLSREYRDRIYALPKDHPKRVRYDAMKREHKRRHQLKRAATIQSPPP